MTRILSVFAFCMIALCACKVRNQQQVSSVQNQNGERQGSTPELVALSKVLTQLQVAFARVLAEAPQTTTLPEASIGQPGAVPTAKEPLSTQPQRSIATSDSNDSARMMVDLAIDLDSWGAKVLPLVDSTDPVIQRLAQAAAAMMESTQVLTAALEVGPVYTSGAGGAGGPGAGGAVNTTSLGLTDGAVNADALIAELKQISASVTQLQTKAHGIQLQQRRQAHTARLQGLYADYQRARQNQANSTAYGNGANGEATKWINKYNEYTKFYNAGHDRATWENQGSYSILVLLDKCQDLIDSSRSTRDSHYSDAASYKSSADELWRQYQQLHGETPK